MIAAVIRWSARNGFLVGFATLFLTLAGIYAVMRVPLDAIPDLSDVQVIVYTEYPGQAPQVVEDQVTYPLTTAMLSVPKSKIVRGFSFFGVSFVYVIFEDGTDLYWARSRVLEYLNSAARRLPAGVTPSLGPDATGVGWVYQYVVRGAQKNLAELRTIQDWYRPLRRRSRPKASPRSPVSAASSSSTAWSIDPRRLQSLGNSVGQSARGPAHQQYRRRWPDRRARRDRIRHTGTRLHQEGSPIWKTSSSRATAAFRFCSRTSPACELTPGRAARHHRGRRRRARRSPASCCSASAPMRSPSFRTSRTRLAEMAPSLPQGVTIEAVYDRSDLIYRAIETLKRTLIEESLIVAAGLRHLPAARAQRAGGHSDPADRRADRLPADAHAGPELEHHEPRRDRDRDRRDGRCGDRDDRERAQAPRAGAARPAAQRGADRGGDRGRAGACSSAC